MGLIITNNSFQGHYSDYGNFRRHLSTLVGIGDLSDYSGFGGEKQFPSTDDEPLVLLIDHSDCDGDLSAEECGKVAKRLTEILDLIDDSYFTEVAKKMISGFSDAS